MQNKIFIFLLSCFVCITNIKAQNLDFELTTPGVYTTSNAVTGWTISSQSATSCNTSTVWMPGSPEFSIVTTPVLNGLATSSILNPLLLSTSPLGGNNIAKLNDWVAGGLRTKIAQTFTVTALNTLFQYCYAGVWEDGGHLCCEQASLKILVYNCNGSLINCTSTNVNATGSGCVSGGAGLNITGNRSWTNWQTFYFDLTPYIGTCITIEVTNSDCIFGTHFGSTYFDSKTVSAPPCTCGPSLTTTFPPSNFCSGTNQAQIFAPLGYSSYQWFAPGNPTVAVGSQFGGNTPVLTATNALAGNVYTVQLVTAGGCTYTAVDTLQYSTVSVSGIGSNSTCPLGASGSASVLATGSGLGYNYTWYVSGNPLSIGTSSYVSNLTSGIYSVNVNAIGSVACGSAAATVTVGISPNNVYTIVKPFCGTEAYLSPGPGGSNFQWYNGTTAISPTLGGNSSGYTVAAPYQGQSFWLCYNTSQGCKDSVKFILSTMPLGNFTVSYNKLICQGAANGQIVFSLTPSIASPPVSNSFSVFTIGAAGIFSTSSSPSAATTFTINNLLAGASYSVVASDGLCKYSNTVAVNVLAFNYSLSPLSSTLCPGNNLVAGAVFSTTPSPAQYSFTWTPNIFLQANYPFAQTTLITPTTAPGTISTIIYTIVSSPTILYCPMTKTLLVTIANLVTPTIGSVPVFCKNSPAFTITTNPSGGNFVTSSGGLINGVITPSLSSPGINTFSYSMMPGTCVGSTSGSFTVNPLPQLSITGSSVICEEQTTTLYASGANSYTWSTGSFNQVVILSPTITSVYSLTGTSTITSCSDTKTISITVNPLPLIGINGNVTICVGESTQLIASGANYNYTWNTGDFVAAIVVSPTITTSYTVTGNNSSGCSNKNNVTVIVSACTAIDKPSSLNESLKIYPNPSGGKFAIEIDTNTEVVITNGLGQIILNETKTPGTHEINMEDKCEGIYFVKIIQGKHSRVVKIIKR